MLEKNLEKKIIEGENDVLKVLEARRLENERKKAEDTRTRKSQQKYTSPKSNSSSANDYDFGSHVGAKVNGEKRGIGGISYSEGLGIFLGLSLITVMTVMSPAFHHSRSSYQNKDTTITQMQREADRNLYKSFLKLTHIGDSIIKANNSNKANASDSSNKHVDKPIDVVKEDHNTNKVNVEKMSEHTKKVQQNNASYQNSESQSNSTTKEIPTATWGLAHVDTMKFESNTIQNNLNHTRTNPKESELENKIETTKPETRNTTQITNPNTTTYNRTQQQFNGNTRNIPTSTNTPVRELYQPEPGHTYKVRDSSLYYIQHIKSPQEKYVFVVSNSAVINLTTTMTPERYDYLYRNNKIKDITEQEKKRRQMEIQKRLQR
jgi:hypothetical protein